ncbi:VOC family protein [Cystobacter fuscus]
MSVTTVSSHSETHAPIAGKVDLKLEAVVIPVSDLDRAKKFYTGLGWRLDADFSKGNARVLQFTPPGSPCSFQFGTNLTSAAPGSAQNLLLAVSDIEAARRELVGSGVQVSEVFHFSEGPAPFGDKVRGPAPNHQSYGSYASFRDPDGNTGSCRRSRPGSPGGWTTPSCRSAPRGTGERAPARGGCPRRAREAHRQGRRGLARLVRAVHDGGGVREALPS